MNQSVSRAELLAKAKRIKKSKPKFCFGKYNGKTLDWVADNDPQYILWVSNNVSSQYWPVGLRDIAATVDPDDDPEIDPFSEDFGNFHE